jgi:RNA polymerase sigma factor (sigma-70 family)
MNDDIDQLRQYASSGSEDAFSAVVGRNLSLVYAAALRRVGGDVQRAEDVTQLVFTALARNASTLAKHPDLAGWLFKTTRFLAGKAIRGERRRQSRDHEAGTSHDAMSDDAPCETSAPLHAVLDDVLMELRQLDRQVILMRFHRGLRLAEIGTQLGATENAVQKRVDRALDQLKDKLARRGITSTAAALTLAFEQQGAVAMPAGLVAAATSAGIACGAGAGSLLTISSLMMISKLQIGLAVAVVVATSAGVVWEVRENAQLRAEAVGQAPTADAKVAELKNKIAVLSQRATAVEADAAALQKSLQAVKSAQSTALPRPSVLTDAREQTNAAMARASRLASEGKLQEALDEYLKCYRNLAGKSQGTLDQQRLMSAIKSLGRTYSPAIAALRELRDTAMQKLQANPGTRDLVSEIGLLNMRLGEDGASMALYDTLPPGDPGRQSLGLNAYNSFVEARRYADALVGKSFGSMTNELEMRIQSSARADSQSLAGRSDYAIMGALSNIEVLTGVGKLDEARVLTEKLLAYDGSDATRAAIKQHVERASQIPAP